MKAMYLKCALIFSFFSLSHTYAQIDISLLGTLPDEVMETSGLIYFSNRLITHNDSGNSAQLFEIDTLSLSVNRTVTVTNATNIDWEDITQDDSYIYIADTGNFSGDRTDLVIYRIAKIDFLASDTVTADRITFSYEDQTDFTSSTESDWDAEALVSVGNHLIVFTKEWKRQGTTAYSISKDPGDWVAERVAYFDSAGLITGGTVQIEPTGLQLIGYSRQLQPFLLQIPLSGPDLILSDDFVKLNMGTFFAQTEAITYIDSNRYFISSEFFSNPNPAVIFESSLYRVTLPSVPDEEEPPTEKEDFDFRLFREFNSTQLHYDLNLPNEIFGRAIFDANGRMIRYTHGSEIDDDMIEIEGLRSAVYYLTFYLNGKTLSRPFIVN